MFSGLKGHFIRQRPSSVVWRFMVPHEPPQARRCALCCSRRQCVGRHLRYALSDLADESRRRTRQPRMQGYSRFGTKRRTADLGIRDVASRPFGTRSHSSQESEAGRNNKSSSDEKCQKSEAAHGKEQIVGRFLRHPAIAVFIHAYPPISFRRLHVGADNVPCTRLIRRDRTTQTREPAGEEFTGGFWGGRGGSGEGPVPLVISAIASRSAKKKSPPGQGGLNASITSGSQCDQ